MIIMEEVCQLSQLPLRAATFHFSMCDPRISSTIIGITRPERVSETVDMAQLPIPAEVWDEFEALFRS